MIRACPHCEKKNRVPERELAHPGRCGACKEEFAPIKTPLNVDVATFDAILANTKEPVLVDFWAPWCGPCKAAAPLLVNIAKELSGRALVVKVDTDQYPQIAARFGVRGIPHFVVVKEGKPVFTHVGLESERAMKEWLTSAGA